MSTRGRGLNFSIRATDRSKAAFSGVQNNLKRTQVLQRSWNAGLNSNRRAVQQFGFQMSDFAIQIAGGQSAMLAFTQQGGQMLQFFGPAGAIAAAFLAVFGSLTIAFTRSGKALSDLTPIMGVLADDFRAIGRGLVVVREILIDFANVVLNNMDRILVAAAMVAGFMIGRWVVAFTAAKISTLTLAGALIVGRAGLLSFALTLGPLRLVLYGVVGALNVLRVALIRLGIGLIIVGLATMVYEFTRLTRAAGGFGNAVGLLADVAKEAFDRIVQRLRIIPLSMKAAGALMSAFFIGNINKMLSSFIEFTWSVADGLNGLFGTSLSGANAKATQTLALMQRGFNDVANSAIADMAAIEAALAKPFVSVKKIKDLIDGMKSSDKIDIRDWFGGKKDDDKDGAASAIKREVTEIEKAFNDMASTISGALGTAFNSLRDRTKSLKDIVVDMLNTILNKLIDTMMNPIWDQIANGLTTALMGSTGTGGGFTGGLLSSALNSIFGGKSATGAAPAVKSYAGGGNTGQGARQGGLDGRGGRWAVVHPNETITDDTIGGSDDMPALEVHIHENAAQGDTEVKQSQGRVDIYMRKMVSDVIGGGGADTAMKRFGIKPQPMGI